MGAPVIRSCPFQRIMRSAFSNAFAVIECAVAVTRADVAGIVIGRIARLWLSLKNISSMLKVPPYALVRINLLRTFRRS